MAGREQKVNKGVFRREEWAERNPNKGRKTKLMEEND